MFCDKAKENQRSERMLLKTSEKRTSQNCGKNILVVAPELLFRDGMERSRGIEPLLWNG